MSFLFFFLYHKKACNESHRYGAKKEDGMRSRYVNVISFHINLVWKGNYRSPWPITKSVFLIDGYFDTLKVA